jgi:hypothetical protein
VSNGRPKTRGQIIEKDIIKNAELKLQVDGDVKGAVRLLASNDGIAPNNGATFESLQEKHPREEEINAQSIQGEPLLFTEIFVSKAIH